MRELYVISILITYNSKTNLNNLIKLRFSILSIYYEDIDMRNIYIKTLAL